MKKQKRGAWIDGVFPHPNMTDFVCPLCGGNEDKPIALVPISGTGDGRICEAQQIHAECIIRGAVYNSDHKAVVAWRERGD